MKTNRDRSRLLVLLPLVSCLLAPAAADELAEKGRAIFQKYQRAVVTVQIVQKMKFSMPGMGAQSNESKQDVTGTVVDSSGLTVVALSACEPGDMLQNLMGGMAGDDSRFKMQTELGDIKLLLDDGAEMPAEIVLRDKDLDLAFLRPKAKPASPMPAVDLSQSGSAQLLDPVVTLNRLGRAAGRAYAASFERISAVVQKPRLFYIPGSDATSTTIGSPAFTVDGRVLGVFVTRSVSSKGGGGLGMLGGRPEGVAVILLPAEDIRKAAKQAPEVRPDDENSKTDKPDEK
jgi:S1-C subfamily serine protease